MTTHRDAIHVSLSIHPSIKIVIGTPNYALCTKESRQCLPQEFSRKDLIHNLQRVAVLGFALGNPDPRIIYGAMNDKIHQPYRQSHIPGFKEALEGMNPETDEGLLGIALSGAGPSVIVIAINNFERIGERLKEYMEGVDSSSSRCSSSSKVTIRILDIDKQGATYY